VELLPRLVAIIISSCARAAAAAAAAAEGGGGGGGGGGDALCDGALEVVFALSGGNHAARAAIAT